MGIPQVPDQVKRVPTLALRAVFAGIGRVLMSADRPGVSAAPATDDPGSNGEHRQQSAARRQPPAAPPEASSRWRSLDQTGNVRLLPAEDLADYAEPSASGSRAPAGEAGPALPLANYDDLSLASIRARLRSLDTGQLRILADHERSNAERPEVLGMLERRIEKVEAGE